MLYRVSLDCGCVMEIDWSGRRPAYITQVVAMCHTHAIAEPDEQIRRNQARIEQLDALVSAVKMSV